MHWNEKAYDETYFSLSKIFLLVICFGQKWENSYGSIENVRFDILKDEFIEAELPQPR